jgi:hypothetical protein
MKNLSNHPRNGLKYEKRKIYAKWTKMANGEFSKYQKAAISGKNFPFVLSTSMREQKK